MRKKMMLFSSLFLLLIMSVNVVAATRYINLTLTYDNKKHDYTAEEVKVAINGDTLNNLQMPPIILNNYTLVPAREVFESVGADVQWKKDLEQVYVSYGSKLVVIPIDSSKAYINGIASDMQTEAKIINNKTMIPLRFVSTAAGFDVEWDKDTRIANIVTNSNTTVATTVETTTQPTTVATTTQTTTQATTVSTTVETTTVSTTINNSQNSSTGDFSPTYNAETRKLVLCKAGDIDINKFNHKDDYYNLVYSLTLSGDYTNVLKNASFSVNDSYVKAIYVNVGYYETQVIIDENRILACDVVEEDGYVVVKLLLPKEKYDKIIVLDAGHGGQDPGANGQGLIEKNLTLNMLLKAKELFDNDGKIKCYVSRATDVYPSFDDRTNLGNEVGDAFISIHINSATSAAATGTETYCFRDNDQGNGLTSNILATKLLNNLLANLGTTNRKVKNENFIVLRQSNIPASLIEIGFITNANDAKIMGSESGQQAVAKAVFDSVTELFNTYKPVR